MIIPQEPKGELLPWEISSLLIILRRLPANILYFSVQVSFPFTNEYFKVISQKLPNSDPIR